MPPKHPKKGKGQEKRGETSGPRSASGTESLGPEQSEVLQPLIQNGQIPDFFSDGNQALTEIPSRMSNIAQVLSMREFSDDIQTLLKTKSSNADSNPVVTEMTNALLPLIEKFLADISAITLMMTHEIGQVDLKNVSLIKEEELHSLTANVHRMLSSIEAQLHGEIQWWTYFHLERSGLQNHASENPGLDNDMAASFNDCRMIMQLRTFARGMLGHYMTIQHMIRDATQCLHSLNPNHRAAAASLYKGMYT